MTSAQAEAAQRWADTIHFGLWQVDVRQLEWQQDMRSHANHAADGGAALTWLREQLDMSAQP